MAGFKTHVTFSSMLGVGYAAGGYAMYDMPWPSCLIAGGLCGVAGMLPDLDSGSGRPIRESMGFAAAVVPMMLIARFETLQVPYELMVLSAAGLYLLIRFGGAWALSKYTVHRGMFHSIPAAILAGLLAFLLTGCNNIDVDVRIFKAGGLFAGYMSHLLLDEIWSIEWHHGLLRTKKSFGTALKFWGHDMWGNLSVYLKLAIVAFLVFGDTERLPHGLRPHHHGEQTTGEKHAPAHATIERRRINRSDRSGRGGMADRTGARYQ